ncbi:hypothetical protein MNBD_CHLOROFLEXI01-3444 [hydrothermal vent metagenome]|uniref:Histidine kinase domain-containing protein n=1 Tax=hydrothermal vent metagenome TaxID=652676 RepID=A0A3B0UWR2_9ZZZZ
MPKKFTVDARTILHLGRDSIKDHTTALLELVKNSYDADATCIEVDIMCQIEQPRIRIGDNGCGMAENDITNHWLRIGYSEKRQNKVSKRGRRKTGEKGIGRISADRLGSLLALHTQTEQDGIIGLSINWDDFESNQNLSDIPIAEISEPELTIPQCLKPDKEGQPITGTELIITKLRQEWTQGDIENLYKELSMLVSPFTETDDFDIKLQTDVAEGYEESVQSKLYDNYEIRLDIHYDGESEEISYTLTERDLKESGQKQILERSIIRKQLFTEPIKDVEIGLGDIRIVLMYYPRVTRILEGSGFTLSDLRSFLNNNAGVKIYRDNIRVKPYGNLDAPEGDWLRLGEKVARDPAGVGRKSFLIRPTQLVGAVFIGRDSNPYLVDSASREGLVNNPEFSALQEFMLGCVRVLSSRVHEKSNEAKESDTQRIQRSPSEEVKQLQRELSSLRRELRSIKSFILPEADDHVENTFAQIDIVDEKIGDAQESLKDLESQVQVYRGLATIGISATVFGHEIQTAIDSLIGSLSNANGFLNTNPPQPAKAIEYIQKSKEHARRVKTWGNFALDRVRRDKRRRTKIDVDHLVANIVRDLEPTMNAVNINITTNLEPIRGRMFAMDIEALLINLLTNAYTACKQQSKKRTIHVELQRQNEQGKKGIVLIVADSGPGIADQFQSEIWKPLWSNKTSKRRKKRKQVGTGLGLTIVQSIVNDLNGSRMQDSDPNLGGARFTIWLPIRKN